MKDPTILFFFFFLNWFHVSWLSPLPTTTEASPHQHSVLFIATFVHKPFIFQFVLPLLYLPPHLYHKRFFKITYQFSRYFDNIKDSFKKSKLTDQFLKCL